jgi:hypothetical protein
MYTLSHIVTSTYGATVEKVRLVYLVVIHLAIAYRAAL